MSEETADTNTLTACCILVLAIYIYVLLRHARCRNDSLLPSPPSPTRKAWSLRAEREGPTSRLRHWTSRRQIPEKPTTKKKKKKKQGGMVHSLSLQTNLRKLRPRNYKSQFVQVELEGVDRVTPSILFLGCRAGCVRKPTTPSAPHLPFFVFVFSLSFGLC